LDGALSMTIKLTEECGKNFQKWNSTYGQGGDLHLNVFPLGTVKDRKKEDGSDFL